MSKLRLGVLLMALLPIAVSPIDAAPAAAGQVPTAQHLSLASILCGNSFSHHCFGPDRDLLVDRLYRVTCAEARDIVEDRGYSRVKTLSCGGVNYKFRALREGKAYVIRVSRRTGAFTSVKSVLK
jgi:hypothetical protein